MNSLTRLSNSHKTGSLKSGESRETGWTIMEERNDDDDSISGRIKG